MGATSRRAVVSVAAIWTWSAALSAQGSLPAVRHLDRIAAVTSDSLGSILGVRQLSDGRVVVNDAGRRKLLIFDSTLHHSSVVMDSLGSGAREYPRPAGSIFAYRGDSTIYVDPVSLALLVLDPAGAIRRVAALPVATGSSFPVYDRSNSADGDGRLIYAVRMRPVRAAQAKDDTNPPRRPDSAVVLRVELERQHVETLAVVRTARTFPDRVAPDSTGMIWSDPVINPLPVADAWAVLSDGTLAIVRAQDFHIDWLAPSGTRSQSPPLPHEWHRLSDSAKEAIVDSVRAEHAAHPSGVGSRRDASGVVHQHVQIDGVPPASELPDYAAPFMAVRADADDNLWIREPPDVSAAGGPIYTIVNRVGAVIDRVEIPGGTAVVGFGKGVVYVSSRTGAGVSVAAIRIQR